MPRKMAGRLRHRVTLEAPVETDDGAGGVILNWSAILSLWAKPKAHIVCDIMAVTDNDLGHMGGM